MSRAMLIRRRVVLVLLLESLLSSALLYFLDLPHGFRAAILRIREVGDRSEFEWNPQNAPAWFRSDPPERYGDFRSEIEKIAAKGSGRLEQTVSVMNYTRSLGEAFRRDRSVVADFPAAVREQLGQGYHGHCGHYSILLFAYLRGLGSDVRLAGMDGEDLLGGDGHTVVEVWLNPPGKWILLDPLNNAFFTWKETPLSLLEIREMAYGGSLGQMEIHQRPPYTIPGHELADYYGRLLSNIELAGDNHLISKEETRFGLLQGLAPLFDPLPRFLKRGLEKLLTEDHLCVHYLDAHATPYRPARYRILLGLLAASLIASVLAISRLLANQFP
ncbi:MAG: transglutaminase domain-containing protein [Candidatus Omnitrophica bacterium]|nr:transglutaminase domain-containing protein [Candidatus Omnitrophota bacterium]